jgi:hypothetical protein
MERLEEWRFVMKTVAKLRRGEPSNPLGGSLLYTRQSRAESVTGINPSSWA